MTDCSTFDQVKTRLDEIADIVAAEGTSLDEALALYEEAVKLGLAACDLSEQDVLDKAAELDELETAEDAAESAAEETPTSEAAASDEGASVE